MVSNVSLRARIPPGDLGRRGIANDALSLAFAFRGGQVRYVPSMTPISAARGNGELKGNRFDVSGVTGKIGALNLANGRVELPRLYPKVATATYAGHIDGEAKTMINLLLEAPIGLQERLPVDPTTVVGRGGANFAIMRQLRGDNSNPPLQFKVDAQLDGVGGAAKDNAFIIANWRMTATGDEKSMTFAGPLRLGASDVTLAWTENFLPSAPAPSSYVIDGRFTPDDLERFGLPAADYAEGVVGMQVKGGGRGYAISAADVKLDLGGADVDVLDRVYVKPRGQAAIAQFAVKGLADGSLQLTNINAKGPGLTVDGGSAVLSADKRIASFQMPRLMLSGGRTDIALAGKRDRTGVLRISGNGASFDAAPFVGGGDDPVQINKPVRKGPPERIAVDLKAKRLLFQGDAALTDARLAGAFSGENMLRLNLRGSEPKGGKFTFALGADDAGASGPIAFHSSDAGFVVEALTGSDHVIGGGVDATGVWRVSDQRADFTVRADKFQVVRLPVMARLLSSVASMRGLSNLMNGEGIDFSVFEGRMALVDDRLTVTEARASGPALGVTAKGSAGLKEGKLAVDGVLVPSYGLNSMLGNVPVLGALLTSRRGEGVIGITYSISGPTEQPKVAVNPLSAITPGIFRRIFEPFSSQRPATAGGAGNGG
jgi:hypothetical protein